MSRINLNSSSLQQTGKIIRNLRLQNKYTGEQLAIKAGISQSRISKIENGYPGSIDINQIKNLLSILDASKTIRQQIDLLFLSSSSSLDSQFIYQINGFPDELNELQVTSTTFRCYIVNVISAVLQLTEYRRAYLGRYGVAIKDVQDEIKHTIERQEALWDLSKSWSIIMPEAALYSLPCGVKLQIRQLDRIERLIDLPNVSIGIIPTKAGLSLFETGSFTIYDDKILYILTGDRVIRSEDESELLKYQDAFKEMNKLASFDQDAIRLIQSANCYFRDLA